MDLDTLKLTLKSSYRSFVDKYYHARDEDERQKFIAYFYITISLFTLSFFGFFAIRPTIITIVNLNRQLKDNEQVLERIKQKQQDLAKLTALQDSLKNEIPLIEKAVPNVPKIPYLSRQIETVALKNNVNLTSLNFGAIDVGGATSESLLSFSISITAEGAENDVNKFIRDLTSMDRLLGFERFTTGKTKRDVFGGTIAMKGYFLP
ncbi:MAG: type 4a pilus biogenesis protein PilO [Candidatus Levybacteria bacterium]|nr:type 4a pilus biogenesis protein PilO [Candidatus Levybacteria bacterium]